MNKFTIKENVIIKKRVPSCGICCSNPERMQRIVDNNLVDSYTHTDSWGVKVIVGKFNYKEVFLATAPMGAAGSAFAFHELYASGATNIIRYGSNDYKVDASQLYDICIIEKADNLYGVMRDGGYSADSFGSENKCSKYLLDKITKNIKETTLNKINYLTCHNIEDYHAYNNPNLLEENNRKRVLEIIKNFKSESAGAWDMESASLYLKAKQFNGNAITVLQSVIKTELKDNPYFVDLKEELFKVEKIISKMVLNTITLED